MLHHPTVERLHELRLFGMAAALADQQSQSSIDQLGFEERLGLLVEREASERAQAARTPVDDADVSKPYTDVGFRLAFDTVSAPTVKPARE